MELGETLPSRNTETPHNEEQQSNSDVRFSVQLMPIPSLNMIFENRVEPYQSAAESSNVQGEDRAETNQSAIFSDVYNNRISSLSPILVPIQQFEEASVAEYQNSNNTNIANDTEPRRSSTSSNLNLCTNEQTATSQIQDGGIASTAGSSSGNSQQLVATARNPDGDEVPEGVDPSFLEALPPEMRREV